MVEVFGFCRFGIGLVSHVATVGMEGLCLCRRKWNIRSYLDVDYGLLDSKVLFVLAVILIAGFNSYVVSSGQELVIYILRNKKSTSRALYMRTIS